MSVMAPTPPPPATPPLPPTPPTAPGPRSGARTAVQIGAVITGALIILGALNLFSLTAGRSTSTIQRTFDLAGPSLVIRSGSADVSLQPSSTDRVEVTRTARVPHGRTMKEPSLSGDVLELPSNCSSGSLGWLWFCSVHYTVQVPAGLQVEVRAGSGDLASTDVAATRLALHTGSGDVTIRNVDAASLSADTGSGDVQATGLASAATVVQTGSGDVHVTFTQAPTTLRAETGSGDLTVRVPRDDADYYVVGKTGSGDFHNRVRSIGEAPPAGSPSRYINAQTGSGDLTIEYAG